MFNIQVTTLDPGVLQAFSNFFNELAQQSLRCGIDAPISKIDPVDSPDAGTDTAKQSLQATTTAAAIFGSTLTVTPPSNVTASIERDPSAVFGAPPPPPTDPASVFGGNVPAASSPTASGAAAVSVPAPSTSAAPVQSSVMLDANGLPWDVRIHAGTRTQTAQGVWKKKKGVDDGTVATVEAELRAALNAPAKPFVPLNAAPPPPAAATAAPPPPATPNPNVPHDAIAPQQPPTTFAELCKYVTGRAFKSEQILAVCNAHSLAGLGLAACRPDLIPSMYAQFAAL